jgi:hypothetical protein
MLCHTLLFPISTPLSHVGMTENRRMRHIPWEDWGATGAYRVTSPGPVFHDHSPLSGSRFLPRPDTRTSNSISVWDFGRACVTQLRTSASESVPFVEKEVALPNESSGTVDAAIGEDVIVIREASIIALSFYLCRTDLHLPRRF